ncbi:M23 family metallopeptidase [Peredibacter starrii]|uniref:M23 family metallopeptidase n=1 Tax=Peredibacter starrii TaxID=28202 RepID=A0AAX4HM82_9BACT|nr:M23 family metallopeptidase [Peredibacter starrii]WPU64447.1 M23 family metallopeptidase [Peredibacter starrii]
MKYISLTLLAPFLLSCAIAKNPVSREETIHPGEVKWLEFKTTDVGVKLFCKGQEVKVEAHKDKAQAIVIESYFSDLQPFTCSLKSNDQVLEEVFFKVVEKEYKAEKLKVDSKRIALSPKNQKRADAEQLVLNKIYASSEPRFLFTKAFQEPMNSVVTSVYGTKRVYNNVKKGQHLGTDYRAAIGDKVPAANAGKVVFAGDLFYTGWTVIIDHGMDVFTVYGHCSKTLVKEGDMVERGQLIALSGNTGRTSGPHLHWGVKIQGQYVDGFVLIDETKKAFKE